MEDRKFTGLIANNFDNHVREVVKGSLVSFSARVLGTIAAFFFNLMIARLLGAKGAGIFFLSLTSMTVASVLARLGLDNALLRLIAEAAQKSDRAKMAAIYKRGMQIGIPASCVVATLLVLSAPKLSIVVFENPELRTAVSWMALAVVPFSLLNLNSALLKGVGKIGRASLTESLGLPLINLILLSIFGDIVEEVNGVCLIYVIGSSFICILSATFLIRLMRCPVSEKAAIDTKRLTSISMSLFLVSIMVAAMGWTDTVMLGIWFDAKDVGIYNIAKRIAMLNSFVLIAVNSIIAPKFAALHARGEIQLLGRLARRGALITVFAAVPGLFVMIFFPKFLLGYFGNEFSLGSLALVVMSLGQIVNVATGSVGLLLMMTGNERSVLKITLVAALLNILLCVVLIPSFGILGAAVANATTVSVNNILCVIAVRLRTRILILPLPGCNSTKSVRKSK